MPAIFPSTKGGGVSTAGFPDVCKTPAPPPGSVPIPYPAIAQTATMRKNQNKVKVVKKETAPKKKSQSKRVSGNEPGTQRSLLSAQVQGEASALKGRLSLLNARIQGLSPNQPDKWKAALEEYVVTASALYVTLSPD